MWRLGGLIMYLLLLSSVVAAQVHTSARVLGMGLAGSAAGGNAGDLLGNPAAVTDFSRPVFLLGHQYMYYQPEVSSQLGLFVLPFRWAHMALVSLHFGLESAYRFTSFGYVFGKRFGPDLSIAWTAHFRHFQIPGHREVHQMAADIGFRYRISDGWTAGGLVKNLALTPFSEAFYDLPSPEVRIGMTRHAGEALNLAFDLAYHPGGGTDLYAGLDYAFVPRVLFMRLGLSTELTLSPYVGLGLGWKRFRFDAASSFHATLGMSPQIDISYVFED